MYADAVFEGGGVRGIAFVGALRVAEEWGYEWKRVGGTSVGSIIAALLAAGYRSEELKPILESFNMSLLVKRDGWLRIPYLGSLVRLWKKNGLYPADPLREWVGELLAKKGIYTFGDLQLASDGPELDRLQMVATNVTSGRLMVLPRDLPHYHIDPKHFPVATAVCMSCALPLFFQPLRLPIKPRHHLVMDGALLSNFPVWLFDVSGSPRWPTFGFRLQSQEQDKPLPKNSFPSVMKSVLETLIGSLDDVFLAKEDLVRTINIPTGHYRVTDFSLTLEDKQQLYQWGEEAAREFFTSWDFPRYVQKYRFLPPSRHLDRRS